VKQSRNIDETADETRFETADETRFVAEDTGQGQGRKDYSVGSDEPTAAPVVVPLPARPPSDPDSDPEKEVYDLGRLVLGRSSGGMVRKLLGHVDGDRHRALAALDRAAKKIDPREYLAGFLRGEGGQRADDVLAETDRLYRELGVQ
jgi:hypothetical protein